MRNRLQTRVPHLRDSRIVAKVGFVRGMGILFACVAGVAHAQSCPQLGIARSTELAYPGMARAAHVSGEVTLLANFAPDGSLTTIQSTEGPEMLRAEARHYVQSWQVNQTPSGQRCRIEISFRMDGESSCDMRPSVVSMSDTQHFTINLPPLSLCDPAADIVRTRHRFLFFRWHTTPKTESL